MSTSRERFRAKVRVLVEDFGANIRELKGEQVRESHCRAEYLDPFWEALGWDVNNRQRRPMALRDVLTEPPLDVVDENRIATKNPDYLFRIGGFARFILEAKKPKYDLKREPKFLYQAKRYAWSARLPFTLISNFDQLLLFDCTLKPRIEEPLRGLVRDFDLTYGQYDAFADVLYDTFSCEAVAAGSLELLLRKLKKLRPTVRLRTPDRLLFDFKGSQPADEAFLEDLSQWRARLAEALYEENRAAIDRYGGRERDSFVTELAGRLLDRLVFIRIAEDRNIITPFGLRDLLERASREDGDVWSPLRATFRAFAHQFNGYLFKPHPLDECDVSNDLLADLIANLYPEACAYRFDAFPEEILGSIYERFIGKVVHVVGHRVRVEEKPEVRHSGGIYYTPSYIVDAIVDRTVGRLIDGKSPEEVAKLRILDPACGSGSFLLGALRRLIAHHEAWYAEHPPKRTRGDKSPPAVVLADGEWRLTPYGKARILESNLHGVDLDPQAVEVTAMSLYLKVLEPVRGTQEQLFRALHLPDLLRNLKCGNSLVGPDIEPRVRDLFDRDVQFRINHLDWHSATRGFGAILKDGGFDAVISNPPYIRVQVLNRWAREECNYFRARSRDGAPVYRTAVGNFDIYVLFIEKGQSLLRARGYLGFICSNKFLTANYGKELRAMCAEGQLVEEVVNFGTQQVFRQLVPDAVVGARPKRRGITTYTCILVLRKAGHAQVRYADVVALNDGRDQLERITRTPEGTWDDVRAFLAPHPTGGSPWAFLPASSANWVGRFERCGSPLGEVCRLFQGVKTSRDPVYVLELRGRKRGLCEVHSEETGREYTLEDNLLRPLVKSSEMRRYRVGPEERVLLFPYEVRNSGWVLVPEHRLRSLRATWAYLGEVRAVLEAREENRMRGRKDWYAYIYPKNFALFPKPKLTVPDMCSRPAFAFDDGGAYYFTGGAAGGVGILPPDDLDPYYLLALLNSAPVADYLARRGARGWRGDWFNCEIRSIRSIPVPRACEEATLRRDLADVGRQLHAAARELFEKDAPAVRERLERRLEALQAEADKLSAKLYGLD